jgi:hypothetical protein
MNHQIQKGIDFIKNADIPNGIQSLSLAYKSDPLHKEIYINLGNAFLGSGDYASAIRSYLTYAHYVMYDDKIDMKSFEANAYTNFYNWSGKLSPTININEDLHLIAVAQDFNFAKIIANTSFTSNLGTAYLTKHQDIVNYNNISRELIMNDLRVILGRTSQRESLRNSSFGALVRNIGVAFLLKNLLTSPELNLNDIVRVYFSEEYSIDDL